MIEEKETEQEIKQDYRILFRLLRYALPYRWVILVAVALLLVAGGLDLAGPYITKIGIDNYILSHNYQGLLVIAALYLAIVLLTCLLTYFQTYLITKAGQQIMHNVRMDLFQHFEAMSLSFFNRQPVGRLVTRLTNDIQSLQEMFTSGLVAVFGDIFTMIGILVVMFLLNVKLTLVALCVMPALIVSSTLFRRAILKTYEQVRIKLARINAFLNEHITGMKIVQLFNAEKVSKDGFQNLTDDYTDCWMKTVLYMALFFPFISLVGGLLVAAVLWFGGGQVLRGLLTFGGLVAFLQYVQRFFRPLQSLSEKYNVLLSAIAAAQKVFTMMDIKETLPVSENPIPLRNVRGQLEFRQVTFAYDAGEPVLHNVSFRIEPGEKIAMVGATGAGKTTIINLLYRFYDVTKGQILIDGRDVKDYDPKELRENFGLVQQDVFLFSGSIFENVRLGNESMTLEAVIDAAQIVNADRFIQRLPQKYYTMLGERGTGLSTGEKQLLALARTMVLNPAIMLVMDEATSNIDSETERLIQQGMERLLKGRTALIIAHRLSTIRKVDRIIVLHKGEVREVGTHPQLLAKRGLYYDLYRLQFQMAA